jgi:osmotically-inducible protein OsmY
LPPDAITAQVDAGWITLSGEVDWFFQRTAAETDVGRLIGVRGVTNQITIVPRAAAGNIAEDIRLALNRSWFFDPNHIAVGGVGGHVQLTGTVRTLRDKWVAEKAASSAVGATHVTNDIRVV